MRHEILLVALEDRFGVARFPSLIGTENCRITVIGNPNAVVSWSRFVDRVIPCPLDKGALIVILRRLLSRWQGPKPWVIFSDEISLEAAASCRNEAWLDGVFPVDRLGPMVDVVLRKTAFMELAQRAGLPIPPMRICHTPAEAEAAGRELIFPLFMKRDTDCAGAGVMLVKSPGDIPTAFTLLHYGRPVLVQQMIHGRLAKANMIYSHGNPLCWSCAYALNTWPGKFGPSCVREYLCDPRIDAMVHRMGELIGFHGLCGFDMIHDETTGEFIVIEFNGRLTPHYHLGVHVGIDYRKAIGDFLEGRQSLQVPRIKGDPPPVIRVFPQDVRRCISEKDWRGLLRWLPGLSTKDIPWGDANLILFFILGFVKVGWQQAKKKLGLGGAISQLQAKSIHEGMGYSEVLANLGPPFREIASDVPIIVYRIRDGREILIALGGEPPPKKVLSVKYRRRGEMAA